MLTQLIRWLAKLPIVSEVIELRARYARERRYDALRAYCADLHEAIGEWQWTPGRGGWVERYWLEMDSVFATAYAVCGKEAEPAAMFDEILRRLDGSPDEIEHVRFVAYLLHVRNDD